jgi:hypothetical protein
VVEFSKIKRKKYSSSLCGRRSNIFLSPVITEAYKSQCTVRAFD